MRKLNSQSLIKCKPVCLQMHISTFLFCFNGHHSFFQYHCTYFTRKRISFFFLIRLLQVDKYNVLQGKMRGSEPSSFNQSNDVLD